MLYLSPLAGVGAQLFDNNGVPLSGGLLYTYEAGTSTPLVTYTSPAGNIANSNPIVLDSAGRPPQEIWLEGDFAYKFVLQNASAVQIWSYDNIVGINSGTLSFTLSDEVFTATQGQTVFTLTTMSYEPGLNNLSVYVNGSKQIVNQNYTETSSTVVTFVSGLNVGDIVEFITAVPATTNPISSDDVSYNEGGTGSIARTVTFKLQESVSVLDFGADATGTNDSTTAIQNAINCGIQKIYFPQGTYKVTSTINITTSVQLYGDIFDANPPVSSQAVIINATGVSNNSNVFTVNSGTASLGQVVFQGIEINGNTTSGTGDVIQVSNLGQLVFKYGSIKGSPRHCVNFITPNGVFKFISIYAYFENANQNGINNDGSVYTGLPCNFADLDHVNCEANGNKGFNWVNQLSPGNGYVRANNLFCLTNKAEGIYIENQGDVEFYGCVAESNNSNGTVGVHNASFVGCVLSTFTECWFSTNYEGATANFDTCLKLSVCGGRFDWSGSAGGLTNTQALRLAGNELMTISNAWIISQNSAIYIQNGTAGQESIQNNLIGCNIQAVAVCISIQNNIDYINIIGNSFTSSTSAAYQFGGGGTIGSHCTFTDNSVSTITNGLLDIKYTQVPIVIQSSVASANAIWSVQGGDNNPATFYNASVGGESSAQTAFSIAKNGSTNRSINAAGTINASGADYAEYMTKSGSFNINKGDICGIDANGKLTNVFSEAISFVVKSTSPSYVGNDSWSALAGNPPVAPTAPATAAQISEYQTALTAWEAQLETIRQTVDRVAFAGQVPVNVTGATVGQYIIPVNNNGAISGQAVSNPTLEQYQISVGKVISLDSNGKPTIIVKVA